MFFPELITGAILIITGVLVKLFPDLIAGYNTLSEAQKKKVNIDGLSTMMKNYLIFLGILVVVFGIVSKQIGMKQQYSIIITSLIIVLVVFLMISKAQKFYKL